MPARLSSRRRWQVVFAACSIGLLVLALAPMELKEERTFAHSDKVAHVVAFACLGFAARRGWPSRLPAIMAGLLAYGAAIEILQSLMPLRSASLADLAADVVGILAGAMLAWAWASRRPA